MLCRPVVHRKKIIKILIYSMIYINSCFSNSITKADLNVYKLKVVEMFRHAYESYLTNAFPYDELKPISCKGMDTWGSFSLTLIDALDTLAVMKNYTEFRRVVNHLITTADFNININVSVFETNIRVVGGLISAHLLSYEAGFPVEPGWPCSGPLLQLAEAVARRLLPAFETNTGMPYGTVNLRYGVPPGETPITCTAGVSTFIVEFGTLSRLTGDPIFENVARKALEALWERRSAVGLVGNHINVEEGKWTAMDAGIGGGIDSYYEYLVKGAILFQDPRLMYMFKEYQRVIDKYMQKNDWYFWVSMGTGQVTMPLFQSLESFWPGLLSLVGKIEQALKSLYNYHQIWKQYGFTPEFYDIPHSNVKREGYPLRPELIESVLYLYQATKDPHLLEIGIDILESIEHSTKTDCGYATVRNVIDHRIEDRMESFFLAETTKYLYLLFDSDSFIHNNGSCGKTFTTTGGDCILGTGYVFNTEAHPIDIAAVFCCSAEHTKHELLFQKFQQTMDLHSLLNINENNGYNFLKLFKQNQRKKQTEHSEKILIKNIHSIIKMITLEKEYFNKYEYFNSFDSNLNINVESTCKRVSYYSLFNFNVKSLQCKASDAPNLLKSSNTYMKQLKTANVNNSIDLKNKDSVSLSDVLEKNTSDPVSTQNNYNKSSLIHLKNQIKDAIERNFKSDIQNNFIPAFQTIPLPNSFQKHQFKQIFEQVVDYVNYDLLSCPAQPFSSRLNVMGEMFNT